MEPAFRGATYSSICTVMSTFICSSSISASTSCWYSFSVAIRNRSLACNNRAREQGNERARSKKHVGTRDVA